MKDQTELLAATEVKESTAKHPPPTEAEVMGSVSGALPLLSPKKAKARFAFMKIYETGQQNRKNGLFNEKKRLLSFEIN